MKIGSLFSGIGGLDLAAEHVFGGETIWHVEHDRAAAAVLRAHWPRSLVVERDVRVVGKADLHPVDIIVGGFPCTDLSVAGKQAGLDGEHSGLYSELIRIVGELRPAAVVIENVPALLSYGERVTGDLSRLGYSARWTTTEALDAGAPHKRRRVFILAYRGGLPDLVAPFTGKRWAGDTWPTPIGRDYKGIRSAKKMLSTGFILPEAVAVAESYPWPTPSASLPNDGEGLESWTGRSSRVGSYSRPVSPPLAIAVGMAERAVPWPTPTCGDAKASGSRCAVGSGAHSGVSLTDAVREDRAKPWPTPTAADGRGPGPDEADPRGQSLSATISAMERGGKLNPDWVESLMGFPRGWTTGAGRRQQLEEHRWPAGWVRQGPSPQHEWEAPRLMPAGVSVKGRPARLRQLGNAVCPHQGAHAITELLRPAQGLLF